MLKRTASAIILIVLLNSLPIFALNIRPAKASGTIYIRADGSIDPPTAPISTVDQMTYIFTGNINDSIVIERSSIIIDGNGYSIQGEGSVIHGVEAIDRSNVTIKNTNIKGCWGGISLIRSSGNNICGNNISNNWMGIWLYEYSSGNNISGNIIAANGLDGIWLNYSSSNNIFSGNHIIANNEDGIFLAGESGNSSISGNNITNNGEGIRLLESTNIRIYHNNFVSNAVQIYSHGSVNGWDDDYPSGGNYWSDYNGTDLHGGPYQNETGSDGIGDTPYDIGNHTGADHYPLMHPWNGFPDLAIENIGVSTYSPLEGQPVEINITIRNVGGSDSRGGSVTLWQGSEYDLPIVFRRNISWVLPLPSIPTKETRRIQFVWNATEILNIHNCSLQVQLQTPIDPNASNNLAVLNDFNITSTTGFHVDVDGFSFANWGSDSPDEMTAVERDLRNYIEQQLSIIFPDWSHILAQSLAYLISRAVSDFGGHCYGMAATSVLYYLNSTLRPVAKETFQMLKNETISTIKLYFLQQYLHALNYICKTIMGSIGITDLRDEYTKILQSVQIGRPLILLFTCSLGRHAVTIYNTYNVSENLKNVVVYDNNFPGMGIVLTFDLENGKVYSPRYDICWSVMADSPASYSLDLATKIIGDFFDNILVTFKRILAFHSPVNVTISDQFNRTISDSLSEIPGAAFEYNNLTDERVFYLPSDLSYNVWLKGYDTGNCTVTQFVPMANQSASSSIVEFDVNASTQASFELTAESANLTAQIDRNGDGKIDEEKESQLASYSQYVSVTNATIPKTLFGQGICIPVNVIVANPSDSVLTFNVTLYANSSAVSVRTVTLQNRTSDTLVLIWNTTGFAHGNYDLTIGADLIPGETKTADNTLHSAPVVITVPGDTNGDWTVDIYDAITLAGAFNSKLNGSNWNGNADINGDNVVDIYDAILLSSHYGATS